MKKMWIMLLCILATSFIFGCKTAPPTISCCCDKYGGTYAASPCTGTDKSGLFYNACGENGNIRRCLAMWAVGGSLTYNVENLYTQVQGDILGGYFQVASIQTSTGETIWTPSSSEEMTGVLSNYQLALSEGGNQYYTGGVANFYYDTTPDYDGTLANAQDGSLQLATIGAGTPYTLSVVSGIASGYLEVTGGPAANDVVPGGFGLPNQDIRIVEVALGSDTSGSGQVLFGTGNVPEFTTIGVIVGVLVVLAVGFYIKKKKK